MDRLTFYRDRFGLEFVPVRKQEVMFMKASDALYSGRPQEGRPKYAWAEAITMALKPPEIMGLSYACWKALYGKENDWKPYHEFGGSTKTANLVPTTESSQGYAAFMYVNSGDRKVTIGLKPEELYMLQNLLTVAAAAILGWSTSETPAWMDVAPPDPVDDNTETLAPVSGTPTPGEAAAIKIRDVWEQESERVTGSATNAQLSIIRRELPALFSENSTEQASMVIDKVFGVKSTRDLTYAQARALTTWLAQGAQPDGTNPVAAGEARAIVG